MRHEVSYLSLDYKRGQKEDLVREEHVFIIKNKVLTGDSNGLKRKR